MGYFQSKGHTKYYNSSKTVECLEIYDWKFPLPFRVRNARKNAFLSLVGTYTLVLIGPASIVILSIVALSGLEALALIALAFGGTVALMILALGKHSGSVINPAVTVAVASAKLLRKDLNCSVPVLSINRWGSSRVDSESCFLF